MLSESAIADKVREAYQFAQQNGNGRDFPTPIVISLELEKIDILSWLQSVNQSPKMYWCSRDNGFEIGGVGSTLTVATQNPDLIPEKFAFIEKILHNSAEHTNIGFIGGTNFEFTSTKNSNWPNFPTMRYILPEIFIHRQKDTFKISISSLIENGISFEDLKIALINKIKSLNFTSEQKVDLPFPRVISKINYPEWSGWKRNVDESLKRIREKKLDKVVLARRTDLQFSRRIYWEKVVRSFKEKNKNCFILVNPHF